MAQAMTTLNSYKILSIDMSYRASGISLIYYNDGFLSVEGHVAENPKFGEVEFSSLQAASKRIKLTINLFKVLIEKHKPNVVIVEMPCFSQSAKSAMAIGMLWGAISTVDCILVEPALLKKWSGSVRGDKKSKVKEKVLERTMLTKKEASNDNIVDAIGLGLLFHDEIRKQLYAKTNS